MGYLIIPNESVVYAVDTNKRPAVFPFGDRAWEAAIVIQGELQSDVQQETRLLSELVIRSIGQCLRRSGSRYTSRLRKVLTLGLSPMFHQGKAFPLLAMSGLRTVQEAYPIGSPTGISDLLAQVGSSMYEANQLWYIVFSRELTAAQLTPADLYFALSLICLALGQEQRFQMSQARQQEVSDQVREAMASKVKSGADQQIETVSPIIPRWTLDDIGGCSKAKQTIAGLARVFAKPKVAERWGNTLPVGILLTGPPGTGKTMLAHAFAQITQKPFYSASIADIFEKWYGESPRRVRALFQAVQKTGGILLLDEADGIISPRDNAGTHEESRRVVDEFCKQMESLPKDGGVTVVLATNFHENLDDAAIRSKRIDVIIKIQNPDEQERLEVLNIHRIAAEAQAFRPLFTGINWKEMSCITAGFSGADLSAVLTRALIEKAEEDALTDIMPPPVNSQELVNAIEQQRTERIKGAHVVGFK